ncbi:YifB family Mg chelatase-like AAA ATPase [Fontimonas sp. SYSU GA230001]|uniref:YifB family Mg chelatase-like AAA ATPase n=1 Tax=Fontimonas sp. SYSU GA230001 TaxID=3142450 RepID=UPI0032B45540
MAQLATLLSRAQNGLDADLVTVEVHLAPGLPGLNIVGLPEAAVREAKDRVKAAIATCGYRFPVQRITCNLAPADLPKDGTRFDLAIALGILAASEQIPLQRLDGVEVLGELSLSGDVRTVPGTLPAALKSAQAGRALLVPAANTGEACLAPGARILAARHLGALCADLHAGALTPVRSAPQPQTAEPELDLADVRGQAQARRALEIAAAGGHSLLLVGPPGAGKSMLARRLPGILPPLTGDEALEVAAVASIGRGGFDARDWGRRPFRAPHHSCSGVALVGGGSSPRPGEITLAHHGVLFLDELTEFERRSLEVLREPLESGQITVSRAARQVDFPARFQLVAAMNPCPCGWLGDVSGKCRCTPDQVLRYRAKVSGPLLDRIDLQIFVPRVAAETLRGDAAPAESSAAVRARVVQARALQHQRQHTTNAALHGRALETHARPAAEAENLLQSALARHLLTARSYHRCLRVARTLADLEGAQDIGAAHAAEALRYRELDRSPQ